MNVAPSLRGALLLSSLLFGLAGHCFAAGEPQKVGVSAAVNPDVTGAAPGGGAKTLVLGENVVYNERIQTADKGQTQLLFLDQSAMTVGPNSDLTIDKFVYDPNSGTGNMTVSAAKGVMRFVGGKLSKQENGVEVKTPQATIAVRGGAFLLTVQPGGKLDVFFIYGKSVTVTGTSGVTQQITRPGFTVSVEQPGAAPSPPAPAPPGAINTVLVQVDGRQGGSGGSAQAPTELSITNAASNSGVSNNVSGNITASVQSATQAQQLVAGNTTLSNSTATSNTIVQVVNGTNNQTGLVVDCKTNNTCPTITSTPVFTTTTTTPSPSPTPTPTPAPPPPSVIASLSGRTLSGSGDPNALVTIAENGTALATTTADSSGAWSVPLPNLGNGNHTLLASETNAGGTGSASLAITLFNFSGNVRSTNGQGTTRGFIDPNGRVSYSGGVLIYPQGAPQQGMFFTTLQSSQGAFPVQFPLKPGNGTLNASQTQSPIGPIGGTTFLTPDSSFFYANLQPVNSPTEKAFAFGGTAISTSVVPNPVTAYAVQPDAALQSAVPFIRNNTGGALPNASVSPLYMVTPSSTTIGNAAGSGNARTLQASLAINGAGANQQSAIATNFGTLQNSNAPGINGVVRGSSMLSSSGTPNAIRSSANSVIDGDGNSIYGSTAVSGFVLDPGASTASEVALNGTANTYAFTQPATATALPAGVGTNRTTQTQNGWFGGTINSTATTRPYAVTGTTSVTTNASTNGVTATFTGAPVSPTATAGVTGLTMQYGGQGAQQAFVDNNNFGAAESIASTQQITLNGQNVSPQGQLYMVTSGTAPPPQSLLPSGASYCACQYLQWGYWGGDLTTANGTANPRVDRGHINFWVAGQPTSAADIASLQTASLQNAQASYTGHAIGSVANNGLQYVAAGAFNQSYNFASQQMNIGLSGFDGRNFSAVTAAGGRTPVTVSGTGNSYTLPVNNTPGFGGSFNGSFYGPQAANSGGNFAIQSTAGPSYTAAGIFAGHR